MSCHLLLNDFFSVTFLDAVLIFNDQKRYMNTKIYIFVICSFHLQNVVQQERVHAYLIHKTEVSFKWNEFLQTLDETVAWVSTYPPDGNQDAAIGVDHEQEGQQEAEDEETQHVGDAAGGPDVPLDRACGAGTLRPVAAPSQQRWQGPEERVEPGAGDAQPGFPEIWGVHLWGVQHGGVTLIGENG